MQIGKFYDVPTVQCKFFGRDDIWPIIGPMHEDKEYIGFEYLHYHLDYRFFTQDQWQFIQRWTSNKIEKYGIGILLSEVIGETSIGYQSNPLDLKRYTLPKPIMRRRKYQREMPVFSHLSEIKWLQDLEDAYADKALLPSLICPHRGASLQGLPIDENGCVTCPLHQLRWNVKTGKLVRWYE